MQMHLAISDAWRQAFPGAVVGAVLLDEVTNPPDHPALGAYLRTVAAELRHRFHGMQPADLAGVPEVPAPAPAAP